MNKKKLREEAILVRLVGVNVTLSLNKPPATVIKAEVVDGDYIVTTEGNHRLHFADIRHLFVVCRGGCKTLFNPRSEYSPDLCDKCRVTSSPP